MTKYCCVVWELEDGVQVEKFRYFPEEFEAALKRVKSYNKKSVGKSGAYFEEAMSVKHLPVLQKF